LPERETINTQNDLSERKAVPSSEGLSSELPEMICSSTEFLSLSARIGRTNALLVETQLFNLNRRGFIRDPNVIAKKRENLVRIFFNSQEVRRGTASFAFNKTEMTLGIPSDLERYADDSVLDDIIVTATHLGMNITSMPSTYVAPVSNVNQTFFHGYFAELRSDQKISEIKYSKQSPYANGRAAARYEVLKALTTSSNQIYIVGVPKVFQTTAKTNGLLKQIVSSTYDANTKDEVFDVMVGLARMSASRKKGSFAANNFFEDFSRFAARFKRTKTDKIKGKKGKTVSQSFSISPTKPSQLRTICPFERQAVRELFEQPWTEMKELEQKYTSAPDPFELDRLAIKKRMIELVDEQWKAKQTVLRLTKARLVQAKQGESMSVVLMKTSEKFALVTNEEEWLNVISCDGCIPWIPNRKITVDEFEYPSMLSALRHTEIAEFPEVCRLWRLLESSYSQFARRKVHEIAGSPEEEPSLIAKYNVYGLLSADESADE
jgi:hypothetical protein